MDSQLFSSNILRKILPQRHLSFFIHVCICIISATLLFAQEKVYGQNPRASSVIPLTQKTNIPSITNDTLNVSLTKDAKTKEPKIINRVLKKGFQVCDTMRKIDVIILHSSYCPTGKDSFDLTCILQLYHKYEVSAHFIIGRNGKIYRLVPENHIAYHGGKGILPDGDHRINTRSIGIEMVNTIHNGPNDVQYLALQELLDWLHTQNNIRHVLGHSDVAPGRKTDPWSFDWKRIRFDSQPKMR